MNFAKHIFQIIFGNDNLKVEEMTKGVKDLLNDFYSAFSSSSTPSMCSESDLSSSYGGTRSPQRTIAEVSLLDVAGGEGQNTFRVARPFLG